MILYFSGTGNSAYVAQQLAARIGQTATDIVGLDAPSLAEDEPLGLVFPVYAWGLPRIFRNFLRHSLRPILGHRRYVWAVMTCGDDMGYADRELCAALGRKPDAVASVQMPNTYVCLPGFDVDAPALAANKVETTLLRLQGLAQSIIQKEKFCDIHRGAMPLTKTYVLRPLFDRFLVTDKYFRTTGDCTACTLCVRDCPMSDIEMSDGRPRWKQAACTGCLRCYHNCPKRAIEWGSFTKGKGQKKALTR